MIFVLGLCCGSFVNMLVYRTAVKYGLAKGDHKSRPYNEKRSFCDFCGRQLKWYENIPVISWVIQKGKTRCCSKKLPVLYPITEIATGLLFLIFNFKFEIFNQIQNLNFSNFQTIIQILVSFIIIIFLVFSAVFDIKYMILPDFSTVILAASALVLWLTGYFGDWNYLLSALGGFLFLDFLYLITKKKGMGFGDVKLAFFMGLFLGYPKIMVAMYVAFIFGAVFGLGLMIFKKAGKRTKISFGPFLILGTIVAWFWGNELVSFSVSQFFR